MTESVACSECGTSYDSQTNAFCPRCGATGGKATPAAVQSAVQASRADPARRRVRRAGVILMALGAVFLASTVTSLLLPAKLAENQASLLSSQPGGELTVLSDIGENVTVQALNGTVLGRHRLVDGEVTFQLPVAAANITVGNETDIRRRMVILVEGDEATLDLTAEQPPGSAKTPLVGSTTRNFTRVSSAIAAATTLLVLLGGLAAFRLRFWGFCMAAASVAALLALIGIFYMPLLGILLAVPLAYAFAALLRGRSAFA